MENNNDNLINVRARPGRPKLALGPDELAAKRLQQREYHRKYYTDHKVALSAYNLAKFMQKNNIITIITAYFFD